MKAILLAAGAGRKMWPYSELRQKCAIPVCNTPAIRLLADDLLSLGVSAIVVGIGANSPSIRHALRGLPDDRVSFMDVSHANGTAEAAWSAIAQTDLSDDWLIVYGDIVCPRENLSAIYEHFQNEKPAAAVLYAAFGAEDTRDYNGILVKENRAVRIEGHSRGDLDRICGVFAFSANALSVLRDNPGIVRHVPVGGMPPLESEIAESIQILIEEGKDVGAIRCPEFFVDLDRPWHILEASSRLLAYRSARVDRDIIPASCQISDGAEIDGHLVLGENVIIGKRAVIQGTLFVGDNTRITNGPILQGNIVLGREVKARDYCLIEGGTVCGDRGVYGHGAEFSGVAFDNVYLYHYCEISGVMGSSVDIGAATVCGTLRFDDRESPQRVNGRWEVPAVGANASYIGDYSRTGVNAIIMPGRTIGNHSCVGAGVIVKEDIPSRQIVTVRQELEQRHWGPEKYGW